MWCMWILISNSGRVTVGSGLFSAQHPPFQRRTILFSPCVNMGCLPLTIAMRPKLCTEISQRTGHITLPQPTKTFSWNVPPRRRVREGLPFTPQTVSLSATTLSSTWEGHTRSSGTAKKRGKTHRGREVKASFRSRCAAFRFTMHTLFCFC